MQHNKIAAVFDVMHSKQLQLIVLFHLAHTLRDCTIRRSSTWVFWGKRFTSVDGQAQLSRISSGCSIAYLHAAV